MRISPRTMHMIGTWCPHILLACLMSGLTGSLFFSWSALFFLYLVVPVSDLILGEDNYDYQAQDFTVTQLKFMELSPAVFIFGYLALLITYLVKIDQFVLIAQIGSIFSLGATGSIVIAACHELIHKRNRLSLWTARLGLGAIGYGHFEYFHLLGHHPRNCTELDVHTALPGESIYHFLKRSIIQAVQLGVNLEQRKAKKEGRSFWSVRSRILYFLVSPFLIAWLVYELYGVAAVITFLGQAIIAVVSLEVISFIQHYNLINPGSSNPPKRNQVQSWDSYLRVSNWVTFMLPRHSDHHLHPKRPFYLLKTNAIAPKMPVGYPVAFILVFLPKYWERFAEKQRCQKPAILSSTLEESSLH